MASRTEKPTIEPVPDDAATWAAAAEDLVKWAASLGTDGLDYSWRSLGQLDRLIERQATANQPLSLKTKLNLGGYVGEVLVRQFGGSWGSGEHYGEVQPPEVANDGETVVKPAVPTHMVERRLAEGAALQSQVFEQSKAWSASSGVVGSAATGTDLNQIPSMMKLVAETFVQPATANGAVWLDYSPASVMLLDDLIAAWWPPKPEKGTYESMIPAMGAYIGQVLTKETGAHWIRDPEGGYGVELAGVVAFPMSQVARRFEMGRDESIGKFFGELAGKWLAGQDVGPAAGAPGSAAKAKRGLFGRRS
jgi:hypothetical protein